MPHFLSVDSVSSSFSSSLHCLPSNVTSRSCLHLVPVFLLCLREETKTPRALLPPPRRRTAPPIRNSLKYRFHRPIHRFWVRLRKKKRRPKKRRPAVALLQWEPLRPSPASAHPSTRRRGRRPIKLKATTHPVLSAPRSLTPPTFQPPAPLPALRPTMQLAPPWSSSRRLWGRKRPPRAWKTPPTKLEASLRRRKCRS